MPSFGAPVKGGAGASIHALSLSWLSFPFPLCLSSEGSMWMLAISMDTVSISWHADSFFLSLYLFITHTHSYTHNSAYLTARMFLSPLISLSHTHAHPTTCLTAINCRFLCECWRNQRKQLQYLDAQIQLAKNEDDHQNIPSPGDDARNGSRKDKALKKRIRNPWYCMSRK